MKILAIDTSCDETCTSLIKVKNNDFKILSNIVSSQIKIHRKYGGVVPHLAKREHQKNLVLVLKRGLKKAGKLKIRQELYQGESFQIEKSKLEILKEILKREKSLLKKTEKFLTNYRKPRIDLISVTQGPGLEPCLWSGVNFARALSFFWQKPLVPVNHIEAHIFANFVGKSQISNFKSQIFPAVCLVASGGHTELFLMKDIGKYKFLGETRDDAAGECFDKVAKILGLPYPGGPEIEKLARKGNKEKFSLPRPMIYSGNYDFSFSGLKTAVLYNFKSQRPKIRKSKKYIKDMAASVQQAIIDVLISKTARAVKEFKVKAILLGGGVISNQELRKQFKRKVKGDFPLVSLYYPKVKFCTDNAVMIGVTGYFNWSSKSKHWKKIKAKADLLI